MRKISLEEAEFNFSSSRIEELRAAKAQSTIVGQLRAVNAIKMGLGLQAPGFNVFVMGDSGTGRRTAVKEIVKDFKPDYKKLTDIAYVYNFKKSFEPEAIFLPGGEGADFRNKLRRAVSNVVSESTRFLHSENYLTKANRIINESNAKETELLIDFEAEMKKEGFKFLHIKQEDGTSSFDLNPILNGEETTFSALWESVEEKKLKETDLISLKKNYYRCIDKMNGLFDSIKINQEKTQKILNELLKNSIKPIIEKNLKPVFKKINYYEYKFEKNGKDYSKRLISFLQNIQKDLLRNAHILARGFKNQNQRKKFLIKYDINLICENTAEKNYVITENLASFSNLFGTIEANTFSDASTRDAHMRVCAGAVHKAFGGFLILRFQDLMAEEESYFYLKRVLQSEKIEIQTHSSGNNAPSIFKPVAIPSCVKVVLIGEANSYDLMYQIDPDFSKLFKICAEFSPVMLRNYENEAAFVALTEKLSKKHSTPKITNSGHAALLTYACKLAGSRNFISTQFAKISDIILQASLLAKQISEKFLDDKIIYKTIDNVQFLYSLPEQEYLNDLKCGVVFLTVSGKKIGSVNGMAVQDRGYFSFGVPEVITAQSSPGETGIINIETEAGFSGAIYNKANLIIHSLLKNTYAKDTKISVDASICFEQSYEIVEGDSASCAEFLALLSSIAQIPLRQDLAITGSLNQHGDVQPIGGVSEKIEGFFKACKILGFTGTQGVVIPDSNLQDLFVSDEILQAIKDGSFAIYTVKTIQEVVELFTGCENEELEKAVQERLKSFNQIMKKIVSLEK